MKTKHFFILLGIFIMCVLFALFALMKGSVNLSISDIIHYLLRKEGLYSDIFWKLRLPRVILALFVGAGLGSCGAVFQGMLRNPLAEPFTLGTSGGAALGIAIGSAMGLSFHFMPLFAFMGALLSVAIVYGLASRNKFSPNALILAGVIMSFFLSSCVLLIVSLVDSQKMHQIILWLMGDLSFVNDANLKFFLFVVPLGILILQFFARDLDVLGLGEEKALHLGLKPENLKKILFIVCSFVVAGCVANCGLIGFVGLVVPHLFRFLGGSSHRYLIPVSALGGALFLLLSDTLARTIIAPMEFPVGVITGFIGGIFFLIYFLRPIKK